MSDFQRYGVYYVPDDPDFAAFGAAWLGWDLAAGRAVEQLPVPGLREATDTTRKYGFHGTLKPPFRLAESRSIEALNKDVAKLAASRPPVVLGGFRLASIGRFLGFVPEGNVAGLAKLAFACVSELDGYRRTAGKVELARRRTAGLTRRQEVLLVEWGYPYVDEELRFHLTLTGKLEPEALVHLREAAERHVPVTARPFEMRSIALAGEDVDGMFHLIHRYALAG